METSKEEENLLLLLQKLQELEARHANLKQEFSNFISSEPILENACNDRKKDMDLLVRHLSSQYCLPILRTGGGLSCMDKQYLNILQSMGQSIHISDSTGVLIYWNKSAENLYGYSASEVLGQNLLKNAAGEIWTGTFPVKNKQGKRFEIFATNTPLYDDYGCIVGIVSVSADSRSFLQLPSFPSLEADSISSQASKHDHDCQQSLQIVVDVPQSPFGVSYKTVHPGRSYRDYDGEGSKIGFDNFVTSKGESWPWKGSEHDGLVARNKYDIFGWMRNEQEDNSCPPRSSDSHEKPELQLIGSNGFGNETNGLWSSSEESNKRCVSRSISSSSSPLCKFDRETDSLHYDISWEELTVCEQIGQGSSGTVYHGLWCGSDVALKVFSKFEYSDDLLHSFRQEVLLMKGLRHPNVLLFMGAVTLPEHLCIVTEFLPRGNLFQLLKHSTCKLDWKRRVLMALDIARGMNYLHNCEPPVVHRDLKSSNLLVDKNWTVKVGDFGLSRSKHATYLSTKKGKGTPQWMAPEVMRNDPSDEKSDVYSFGVILWELATRKIPWDTLTSMQVIGAVGFMDQRIEIPKDTDPQWASLIESCWHSEPKSRPSFQELLEKLKVLQKRYSTQPRGACLDPGGSSIRTLAQKRYSTRPREACLDPGGSGIRISAP
ncbi:hypothetical protein MKW94_000293 [Papaver nudicaule]|uniref:non-specific serine/threonine protein kinase n=1 Tax=Papaver nudicaule TaxID=74823 RepID=A0AA41RU33_PAPNU|nr:hypothetical protein [Papaver nudicaule]